MRRSQQQLFSSAKTYAKFPVWKDSTRREVPFYPMPRRRRAQLWHDARRFERQTRVPGKQDGALGRNGLAILYAMLFDAMGEETGRLDPSYSTLARLANISVRSVHRGLSKLKSAGVLHWVRRCIESVTPDGQYRLAQDTNAYGVQPESQWRGFRARQPAPPPEPGTWGDHPPMPSVIGQAADWLKAGGGKLATLALLESDPSDRLALALGSLARARNP